MQLNSLAESLSSIQQKVPDEIGILEVRRHTIEDNHRRLKKLLRSSHDICGFPVERGHWTQFEDRTLVRLPENAYAVVYHASGAVRLDSGMAPMSNLFKEMLPRDMLISLAETIVKDMALAEQLPKGQSLSFERLWQIKASGIDRAGKTAETVLCRAVGAFRRFVGDIPVLGPASIAVKVSGDNKMDSLSMLMRGPELEQVERARVIHPERAVRHVIQRVEQNLSHIKEKHEVLVETDRSLQFGYISLPKRKLQRVLAPAYVANISVSHALERQAFTVIVPATERTYVEFDPPGQESPIMETSKRSARCCC